MDCENKIKHLEMVEAIIERMAKNCFQHKGWAMTLVAIVGSLAAKDSKQKIYNSGVHSDYRVLAS